MVTKRKSVKVKVGPPQLLRITRTVRPLRLDFSSGGGGAATPFRAAEPEVFIPEVLEKIPEPRFVVPARTIARQLGTFRTSTRAEQKAERAGRRLTASLRFKR